MLATPTNISIGQASSYYTQERGYYMDKTGPGHEKEWHGKLMEHYQLEKAIDPVKFDNLINEHSGKQIELDKINAKYGKELKARAGIDLVFSVPKSFSIALNADANYREIIQEGHRLAVNKAMDHIEKNYIYYRQRHGKERLRYTSDNMLVAKIEHHASRSEDMDYHTHCVILNKTKCPDKKLRVISNEQIFKNQKLISQIYDNTLYDYCRAQGMELRMVDLEKSFFEIEGITREQIEQFSKRWQEIQAKIKELQWDDTPKNRKKVYEMTRKRKTNTSLENLQDKWTQEIKSANIELPAIDAVQVRQAQESKEIEKVMEKALDQVAGKNFAFRKEDFILAAMKKGLDRGIDFAMVDKFLQEKSGLLRHDENGENFYTTQENYEIERDIYQRLQAGLGQHEGMDLIQVRQQLAKTGLTQEQQRAVEFMCSSRDRYIAIQGFAGTGKTFMFNEARQIWEKQGYQVTGMSPVGAAARNLQDEAGIPSSTIHRFLNQLEKEAGNFDKNEDFEKKLEWRLNGLQPGTGREAWVVDESSMLNIRLLHELQKAAEIKGAKVVLAGCYKQMQAIGEGSIFRDLIENKFIGHAELTEIRRQRDLVLKSAVQEVIKGNVKQSLEKIGNKTFEEEQQAFRFTRIATEYAKRSEKGRDNTMIITGMNRDRTEINHLVRAALIEKGRLSPEGVKIWIREQNGHRAELEFCPGDKIMFLKNDRKLDVQNGLRAICESVDKNKMIVMAGGRKIEIDLKKYNNITHGYCLTPYKAQGLGEDRVIINLDTKQRPVNSRNAYYVDISRGKQEAIIFTNNKKDLAQAFEQEQTRLSYRDFEKDFTREAQELERTGLTPELDLKRDELRPEVQVLDHDLGLDHSIEPEKDMGFGHGR